MFEVNSTTSPAVSFHNPPTRSADKLTATTLTSSGALPESWQQGARLVQGSAAWAWAWSLSGKAAWLFDLQAKKTAYLYTIQQLQQEIAGTKTIKDLLRVLEKPELQPTIAQITQLNLDDKRWQRAESLHLFSLLGEKMPKLRHLSLRHNQLRDTDAIWLSNHIPYLQSLCLQGNDIGEEGLMSLAERLPKLHTLFLGEAYLPSQILQDTLPRFKSLGQLGLIGLSSARAALATMLASQPHLQSLTLKRIRLQPSNMLNIAPYLRPLHHLALIDNHLDSLSIAQVLASTPALRSLELQGNPVRDGALIQLGKQLPSLQRLNLAGTQVTAQGLATFLPIAKQLRWLNVDGIPGLQSIAPLLTATFGYNVSGISNIATLESIKP